ncbi:hypothetical protein GCM10009853_069680 [Glycomyces scopariae]
MPPKRSSSPVGAKLLSKPLEDAKVFRLAKGSERSKVPPPVPPKPKPEDLLKKKKTPPPVPPKPKPEDLKKKPPPVPPKPKPKQDLTPEDEAALSSYTQGGFRQMNPHLRDPSQTLGPMRKKFDEKADRVSEALGKLPNEPGKTYRGADLRNLPDVRNQYQPGNVVKENAFTSTSKNQDTALSGDFKGDTLFNINGKNGKNVTKYSPHDEEEILFDKGTSFRVDSVTRKGNMDHINMTEL